MNYLVIDTTSKSVLCLAQKGDLLSCVDNIPSVNTSCSIIPEVDKALQMAGLRVADLDVVAAVAGPGSFTGIRIGVSVANAFALRGVKRLAVNALDAIAFGEDDGVVAAIPSRLGYAYTNRGELSVQDVASLASVGVEDSGASRLLSRIDYIQKLRDYVVSHFDEASEAPIEPVYLKKSQAERMREGGQ